MLFFLVQKWHIPSKECRDSPSTTTDLSFSLMESIMFTLIALVSFASAATPVAPQTPVMGSGSNIDGCESLVSSATSAKKTGDLALKLADAEVRCLAEKNREELIKQDAESKRTRADAESGLIAAVAIPVMNGDSVNYSSDGNKVKIATGSAAEWQAYGTAVSSGNGLMNGIGGMNGMVDPRYANLYMMDQARAGSMNHPALPAVPNYTPATPASTTNDNSDEIAKLKEEKRLLEIGIKAAQQDDDGS